MNQAKQQILQRLRAAPVAPVTQSEASYQAWQGEGPAQIREQFIQALQASHADVRLILAKELETSLGRVLKEYQLTRVAMGQQGEFSDQIGHVLGAAGRLFNRPIESWKDELFDQVDAGITHCLAGIGQTGSLVLWPDENEPRTLSLVPPCHIALIKTSSLVSNFSQLMEQQNWAGGMPTNALLISGPSKTADIQQTLAYGAHGPSQLVVLLIEDSQ